jgi:PAS domain S-box-containing protein
MRILLVEDNADHRELMGRALTGHDSTWEVEGVGFGEEALCLLLGGAVFDLVFLDYSLPQRDGLWFLGEIRRGKAPPPVVMVTGRGDEQVAVEAMKRGAYDYVVKQEGYLERLPVVARHALEANRLAMERKQAEEKLRFHGEIMKNMSEGVYLIRLSDGLIVYTNPKFERIFGYEAGEMIGKPVTIVNAPTAKSPEETAREIIEVLNRTGVWYGEVNNIKKDGTPFWCYAGCSLFEHPEYGKVIVAAHTDITERKQTEEALRVSLEKYRILFESFPLGITISDKSGKIMEGNRQSEQLLGTPCEAHAQRRIDSKEWQIIRKDGTPMPADEYASARALRENRLIENVEMGIVKDKGEITWISVTAAPIPLEDYGVAIAYGDITERKRAEEALRRTEENFRRSLDDSPLGVRIVTTEGETIYTNRAILEIYGYDSIEELRTTPVKKRYTPESYAGFQIRKKKRQRGEYDPPEYEISIVRKNGEVRHLEVFRKEVLWNGEKQYQAIYLDITERKRAEEALQTSKELFEKIFISQMDAIFLLDAINPPAILDCNPAATEVFGYTRQEMAGRTTDFLHVDETAPKKFLEHLYSTLFKRGFLHQFEFQMRRKDGTIFPTEHSVTQLKDEQDKRIGWVNVVRDITERKWAEERILTYQGQLRSLMTELSLIEERERRHIATELHDNISQTLAITKIKLGMAQGLTSSTDWVGSLNEIGELIDQAIQYTRSLTFELSPPILYELGFEAAAEWLTEQIQEQHHIEIGFEDDRRSKPMSEEIRIALFKATKELLINIVKHAQASKAKVSIWREDHSIRIRVEDDGVGFSTSEGKQLRKTSGFGLFNIRERVKYLGGDVVIESEPGRGSRVTLSAPLEEKEDKKD